MHYVQRDRARFTSELKVVIGIGGTTHSPAVDASG
jgi:hypothetical protein